MHAVLRQSSPTSSLAFKDAIALVLGVGGRAGILKQQVDTLGIAGEDRAVLTRLIKDGNDVVKILIEELAQRPWRE